MAARRRPKGAESAKSAGAQPKVEGRRIGAVRRRFAPRPSRSGDPGVPTSVLLFPLSAARRV